MRSDITQSPLRSVFGPTILAASGVFYVGRSRDEAERELRRAKTIYPDFKVVLADLSIKEDKILAVDVDPDLGDLDEGYAVLVQA
ncbi:hypothetical protein MetMK1DRAFT_00019800 [Metallosphaera yellowstonensis MK1]|jgi:hypothetical protein|uniref:Uncharacterized protein n=1 Tax=Metallosphaera yellowstonensis MK1 TaxID=671065 RepID=H2C606_9CREN|nr:hypothetical protein MetMK1DRAFT_00019800 [Metallosphaera yellowstonensis MK1]